MTSYRIIDEPRLNKSQHLIVDPTLILFAAMLVPMLVNIPLYGKFWLPFLWLMLNSFFLGSPTFWRECVYSVLGICAIAGVYLGYGYGIKTEVFASPKDVAPYVRVLLNAVYFISLYLVVFTQTGPFSIYQYVRQGQHE